MPDAPDKVLVTGASGFLGSHVTQQLLQAGNRVRGTVRDLNDETKVEPLYSLCPDAKYPLELVEADLMKPETLPNAVEGCSHVIHTASPRYIEKPRYDDEVVKPAVEGTLNVLKACTEVGGVKRVVMTSHMAAIYGGTTGTANKDRLDENDWTSENHPILYHRSRVLAEKAAWNYVNELPEHQKFEMSVINPGCMFGPILCGGTGSSIEFPSLLLKGDSWVGADVGFDVVDVRDVAAAHMKAMTLPEAAGHRHALTSQTMGFMELAKIMSDEFNPQGYGVPTHAAPKWLLKGIGLFSKDVRNILPLVGSRPAVDNKRMREVLGIEPRDIKKSILEMCYECIEKGYVHKTEKYTGPGVKAEV